MSRIPGSLRALLTHLIDYAGLYPPAALPLPAVIEKYRHFLKLPESWILNRLVLPAPKLAETRLEENWRITLLVESEPGPFPRQVETLETGTAYQFSLPVYRELPLDEISDGRAKIRTGGVTPDSIPETPRIADFLYRAAARRLAFKATAGLHHPIRSIQPLTGASDSPVACMHGFVNVFVAAAFAWQGVDRDRILEILNESDPGAFHFLDDELRWQASGLSITQVEAARAEFAHSFGSCSFEEPISDLRELGLLV